jgi:integrase/recombinase XerD
METIILKPLYHRGQECIAICFDSNLKLNSCLRKIDEAKWSQTNKCWYVPMGKETYDKVFSALKGKVRIEQILLRQYLADKKNNKKAIELLKQVAIRPAVSHGLNSPGKISSPAKRNTRESTTVNVSGKIHAVNAHVLPAMRQKLKLKAYSASTIKTYINEMTQLLEAIKNIPADELTPEHLRRYLVYCYEKLKLTENTLHSRINAMKFYYEQVLGRERFFWEIPRPKKQYILPKVLGETELRRLFNALLNKKHKAILFTAYSAGLRVSEVVNLQLKHVDRSRMQILIERAKGKKDRYVMLSPVLLDILSNYYRISKPKPVKYIFEGPEAGTPYSASSMQKIFQVARRNAGIHKNVTFHSLRHSFATHLLEKGIDIKYIRDLLGHFDIRTTARYLHVKKEQLVNIESPLDGLILKYEI